MNRFYPRLILATAAVAVLSYFPALADAGSVTVTGSSSSGARVVLTSDKNDFDARFDLKFEELPGELRITMKKKESLSSWSTWFNSSKIRFEIQVPTKTSTDLQTGGGHVKLVSMEGEASLETSGGHIEVTDLRGNLTAETSGGHIAIKRVSGNAKVETSGGHIEIHGAKGRVDADTSGGHVEVSFASGNAHGGRIESSGGGITIAVDPSVDLSIDASTSGGTVRNDIPITVVGKVKGSSIKGTLGKGGETLYVHTSGGSVRLGAVDAAN